MDDIARLRKEYSDRDRRLTGSEVYSWLNPAYRFIIQQRQRVLLKVLKRHNKTALSALKFLEMGCGSGGVLKEFLLFGIPARNLHGVDLLGDKLLQAAGDLPGSQFACADGQSLPFSDRSFDIVLQFTALSSILDPDVRHHICQEMLRVVRKNGLILSYDFWLNPTNPQTRGLGPEEIRQYFIGCRFEFIRLTLAPPIARRLVPVSWQLCALLEKLTVFNSHYLSVIQPT